MQGVTFIHRSLLALALVALPASAGATSGTMWITSDTTLTEDHQGTIIIDADDVTLDCRRFRLTPNGEFANGIAISGVRNVRVFNCWVTDFFENITLFDAHNVILENSEFTDGETGILVRGGAFVTIIDSSVMRNTNGVDIDGSSQVFISHNQVAYNRAAGFVLSFVGDAYIENNSFIGHNGTDGLDIASSSLVRVTNNVILSNREYGVDLQSSNNCIVQHNDLRSSGIAPLRVLGGSDNITDPNTF
jgi:parallel beta-helix repeat protein